MTTKINFENEIEKTMKKSLLTKKEKELENAFLEILENDTLRKIAKNPNIEEEWMYGYEIFYSSEPTFLNPSDCREKGHIHPVRGYVEKQPHAIWALGPIKKIIKSCNGDSNKYLKLLLKKYGHKIGNELGIIKKVYDRYQGSGYIWNIEETDVHLLSKSVYEKNPNEIKDLVKSLDEKWIYPCSRIYSPEEREIVNGDLIILDKGLNKKRLQEIVIENWVKPYSNFIR